jgi:hypothetical protein
MLQQPNLPQSAMTVLARCKDVALADDLARKQWLISGENVEDSKNLLDCISTDSTIGAVFPHGKFVTAT